MTTANPLFLTTNEAELWLLCPDFEDLLLTGENTDLDGHVFTIKALAEGATLGNPVPVDVSVQRWMTDGAVTSTQGHEDREIFFNLLVSAGNASDLAAGEAALALRANQVSSLKWVPPTGPDETQPTVFEIWTWHLEHSFDLDRELRLTRSYGARFSAKPWARSEDVTTVEAVSTSAVPTITSIDNCSSLTNWTGSPNTPTVVGGTSIREQYHFLKGVGTGTGYFMSLIRTGGVSGLGSTPFLVIDASLTGGSNPTIVVTVDSVVLTQVAAVGTSLYFDLGGRTSFAELRIIGAGTRPTQGYVNLTVNDVSASDTVGGIGSAKQLTRSFDVGGSVKTSGSILVSGGPNPLGNILVYTTAANTDYTPPIRQYRTSGNSTATDATAASGTHETLVTAGASAGTISYSIPPALLPEATYVVLARIQATVAGSTTITFSSRVSGSTNVSIQGRIATPTINTWTWGAIGVIALPAQSMPAESQNNNNIIDISATATASANVTVDEFYLLDVTHGDFTMFLDAGTHTRLWIDAPDADLARNRPAIYMGTADDRADALTPVYTQIMALGDHDLDPRGAQMFTVTDAVNNAVVTVSFYQRWHTHAGS